MSTTTPDWLPDLLAIRTANPGQPPSLYGYLMANHGIATDGRTVKALLKAWDANPPKTVSNHPG